MPFMDLSCKVSVLVVCSLLLTKDSMNQANLALCRLWESNFARFLNEKKLDCTLLSVNAQTNHCVLQNMISCLSAANM